jgi:hypothetical protein
LCIDSNEANDLKDESEYFVDDDFIFEMGVYFLEENLGNKSGAVYKYDE